jgi:hypothetical protein
MPIVWTGDQQTEAKRINYRKPQVEWYLDFQRQQRAKDLKRLQRREDGLLILWAGVALLTGVLLVLARSI